MPGPAAPAELLFALRSNTLPPWDNEIAQRLYGATAGRTMRTAHAQGPDTAVGVRSLCVGRK
jgi:hypothetical protein